MSSLKNFALKSVLRSPDSLDGSTGLSEDLALLNEEIPPKEDEPKEDEHEETDEERETREEAERLEEEEEGKGEPTKELAPHERPTFTDLKKYDDKLFDKFPGLKDVIFREKAYTELFTNIDDAKTALESAQALDSAKSSIFEGDGTAFLSSIKETDPKALIRFSERILPALFKVDQDAHWAAANPILESMVRGLYESAKDDKTKDAAKLFAEYCFGEQAQDILDKKKTFIPTLQTEEKKDPEREKFYKERYEAFDSDIRTMAFNGLSSMITAKDKNGKDRLDPDEIFSPWMRKTLIEKISQDVQSQMSADKDHMKYMDGLWEKAKKSSYTAEWKTRIISAFLARARQLVTASRSRLVSEALGTESKRSGRTREVAERTRRPEGGGGGAPAKRTGTFDSSRKVDYSKTSDEDLINDNITYRS